MVIVISWCVLDGHCYFVVCSGWSLLFPGVLWMVTGISWCALDGHRYFVVRSGWSLSFLKALRMVTISASKVRTPLAGVGFPHLTCIMLMPKTKGHFPLPPLPLLLSLLCPSLLFVLLVYAGIVGIGAQPLPRTLLSMFMT